MLTTNVLYQRLALLLLMLLHMSPAMVIPRDPANAVIDEKDYEGKTGSVMYPDTTLMDSAQHETDTSTPIDFMQSTSAPATSGKKKKVLSTKKAADAGLSSEASNLRQAEIGLEGQPVSTARNEMLQKVRGRELTVANERAVFIKTKGSTDVAVQDAYLQGQESSLANKQQMAEGMPRGPKKITMLKAISDAQGALSHRVYALKKKKAAIIKHPWPPGGGMPVSASVTKSKSKPTVQFMQSALKSTSGSKKTLNSNKAVDAGLSSKASKLRHAEAGLEGQPASKARSGMLQKVR